MNRVTSYYEKYPYVIGKFISLYRRSTGNLPYFSRFPVDSLRELSWLMGHGL